MSSVMKGRWGFGVEDLLTGTQAAGDLIGEGGSRQGPRHEGRGLQADFPAVLEMRREPHGASDPIALPTF